MFEADRGVANPACEACREPFMIAARQHRLDRDRTPVEVIACRAAGRKKPFWL